MSADPHPARTRFELLAAAPDARLDLEEGAILIAAEEYPDLQEPAIREELDALGETARARLAQIPDEEARVECLNRFLFEEEGFVGASEYYDPRNSFLNEVLDRRIGIPISLSLVYMAVGRRAGLDVSGVSFPGHFLVRCHGSREQIVDAFSGRRVAREECERRLASALTPGSAIDLEEHLRDASPREILVRMLSNLQRIFAEQGDADRLLACCDRILLLTPENPVALRDRGLVYESLGWLSAAIADLEASVARLPDGKVASSLRARSEALRELRGPLQ